NARGMELVTRAFTGNLAQALDDSRNAVSSLTDAGTVALHHLWRHRALFIHHVAQVAGQRVNDAQRIVDFMRDAAGHHAQRGKPRGGYQLHFIGLDLSFHVLAFGYIQRSSNNADYFAAFIQNPAFCRIDMAYRSIWPNNAELHEVLGLALDGALQRGFHL